jgi:hypothetical protein
MLFDRHNTPCLLSTTLLSVEYITPSWRELALRPEVKLQEMIAEVAVTSDTIPVKTCSVVLSLLPPPPFPPLFPFGSSSSSPHDTSPPHMNAIKTMDIQLNRTFFFMIVFV